MKLALIAAMSENGVIGRENKLPWHLPEDLKHFKKMTMGSPVIMGRKTYDSIGRVLPGRKNIILSRQSNLKIEGATVVADLESALKDCEGAERAFVIGGAELYRLALPKADSVFLTIIHKKFDGDAVFPAIDFENDFKIVSKEDRETGEFSFSFIEARRS